MGEWADANDVELAYTPHYASWLNRIEAQFQALRYSCLDGTDHGTHREQASMIRRYIIWRNRNAHDRALQELVGRARRCLTRHWWFAVDSPAVQGRAGSPIEHGGAIVGMPCWVGEGRPDLVAGV